MVSKNPYMEEALFQIERDKEYSSMAPTTEHVFFNWRSDIYKGSINIPFDKRPEIAIISRSNHLYELEVVEAIRALDSENERPYVDIADEIEDAITVAHIENRKVTPLNSEEDDYFQKNKPIIAFLDLK